LQFSKLFLQYSKLDVDFSKPQWYYVVNGGAIMYKERTTSCGERIKIALDIRNMKQCDLCKLANIPKSSLSLYLQKAYEPKQDRIFSMARVLNVSEAWLMGYDVPIEREDTIQTNNVSLSEQEQLVLELFKQVPESKQQMVIQMIRVALDNQK
jgi:transcriptional regulator with XRE-family HTH domain